MVLTLSFYQQPNTLFDRIQSDFRLYPMAMHIHLTPEKEEIIKGENETGHCRTAEEVVAKALQALRDKERSAATATSGRQQREAVLEMLDFAKKNHVRLDGV